MSHFTVTITIAVVTLFAFGAINSQEVRVAKANVVTSLFEENAVFSASYVTIAT